MADAAVELPAGTRTDSYVDALRATLSTLPASTDVLVVSLGYDTLKSDPEAGKRSGGLCLETEAFRAIGEALSRSCRRVLIVQEGGYDLDAIPQRRRRCIRGLTSSCASGSRWVMLQRLRGMDHTPERGEARQGRRVGQTVDARRLP